MHNDQNELRPKRQVRGIVSDLEGAIIDLEELHAECWLRIAAELGLPLTRSEAEHQLPHFPLGPDPNIGEDIIAQAPRGHGLTSAELFARKWEYANTALKTRDVSPRPGFLEQLKKIREHNVPVTLISSPQLERGQLLFERSGLNKLFGETDIIYPSQAIKPKPAPDYFIESAKRMNIHPKEQLVFDDSPLGIEAASAAGSLAIGMPMHSTPESAEKLRRAGAVRTFFSWEDMDIDSLLEELGNE